MAAAALTSEARITRAVAPKLIALSWIISMLLSLPWIIKREFKERQWKNFLEMYCVEDINFLEIYWHFIIIMIVWLPLGVMIVTYGAILWRLEWSARELASRGGGQTISRAKGKAMRITAFVLLAAVVCRLPYTVLVYWRNNMPRSINAVEGAYEIVWFTANFLLYLNCAINPLIYGFTNTRFRNAMDRTPGLACFRFGYWCCFCSATVKKTKELEIHNPDRIYIIDNVTPKPNRKLSHAIKNFLHFNKHTLELSIPKVDEPTTKPTRVTPLRIEQFN
ncbi:RYamide receptor [Leptidea sinapis]|uniref:RYamide receptor n=1 Tax=Leptidea sinapis TaxID=189913 RepID=UPI0021C461BC|nr:RYamide receptor [Leptidea sinapis]